VGPTDVVTHEIGRLVDVASGRMVGDGDGGEKKGWVVFGSPVRSGFLGPLGLDRDRDQSSLYQNL